MSIHRAVKSLSWDASCKIKMAVHTLTTAFAYDNFDINFKLPEPTVERFSSFVCTTSAMAIPLFGIANPEALWCSQCYWEKDPRNLSPSAQPIKIHADDLSEFYLQSLSRKTPSQKLSPLLTNYAWHIHDILIQWGEHFESLPPHLSQPITITQISLHQTTQIPCWSMNIKESTSMEMSKYLSLYCIRVGLESLRMKNLILRRTLTCLSTFYSSMVIPWQKSGLILFKIPEAPRQHQSSVFNMLSSYLASSILKWLVQMCFGEHGCSQKTHELTRTVYFSMLASLDLMTQGNFEWTLAFIRCMTWSIMMFGHPCWIAGGWKQRLNIPIVLLSKTLPSQNEAGI